MNKSSVFHSWRYFHLECKYNCQQKHKMLHKFWKNADPECIRLCVEDKFEKAIKESYKKKVILNTI